VFQLETGNGKVAFLCHTGHNELQLCIIFKSQQNTRLRCGRTPLYIISTFWYVIITHFHYRYFCYMAQSLFNFQNNTAVLWLHLCFLLWNSFKPWQWEKWSSLSISAERLQGLLFKANSRIGCDHWISILPSQLTDWVCMSEVLWTYIADGYVRSCHNWGFS
jgi:hypothetical protein